MAYLYLWLPKKTPKKLQNFHAKSVTLHALNKQSLIDILLRRSIFDYMTIKKSPIHPIRIFVNVVRNMFIILVWQSINERVIHYIYRQVKQR
jgi:hypothetical protein